MTKRERAGWIVAAVGGLIALAASMMRTFYGIWPAILLVGVIVGTIGAIGEWRAYRRSGRHELLWGAIASLVSVLLLGAYLIGSL